jgi:hypothetical protein
MDLDLRLLLGVTQAAYAVLTAGLAMNWLKNRNAGVFLSFALFGSGAYFSFRYNEWWPLIIAFAASFLLKSMGFQTGYH